MANKNAAAAKMIKKTIKTLFNLVFGILGIISVSVFYANQRNRAGFEISPGLITNQQASGTDSQVAQFCLSNFPAGMVEQGCAEILDGACLIT